MSEEGMENSLNAISTNVDSSIASRRALFENKESKPLVPTSNMWAKSKAMEIKTSPDPSRSSSVNDTSKSVKTDIYATPSGSPVASRKRQEASPIAKNTSPSIPQIVSVAEDFNGTSNGDKFDVASASFPRSIKVSTMEKMNLSMTRDSVQSHHSYKTADNSVTDVETLSSPAKDNVNVSPVKKQKRRLKSHLMDKDSLFDEDIIIQERNSSERLSSYRSHDSSDDVHESSSPEQHSQQYTQTQSQSQSQSAEVMNDDGASYEQHIEHSNTDGQMEETNEESRVYEEEENHETTIHSTEQQEGEEEGEEEEGEKNKQVSEDLHISSISEMDQTRLRHEAEEILSSLNQDIEVDSTPVRESVINIISDLQNTPNTTKVFSLSNKPSGVSRMEETFTPTPKVFSLNNTTTPVVVESPTPPPPPPAEETDTNETDTIETHTTMFSLAPTTLEYNSSNLNQSTRVPMTPQESIHESANGTRGSTPRTLSLLFNTTDEDILMSSRRTRVSRMTVADLNEASAYNDNKLSRSFSVDSTNLRAISQDEFNYPAYNKPPSGASQKDALREKYSTHAKGMEKLLSNRGSSSTTGSGGSQKDLLYPSTSMKADMSPTLIHYASTNSIKSKPSPRQDLESIKAATSPPSTTATTSEDTANTTSGKSLLSSLLPSLSIYSSKSQKSPQVSPKDDSSYKNILPPNAANTTIKPIIASSTVTYSAEHSQGLSSVPEEDAAGATSSASNSSKLYKSQKVGYRLPGIGDIINKNDKNKVDKQEVRVDDTSDESPHFPKPSTTISSEKYIGSGSGSGSVGGMSSPHSKLFGTSFSSSSSSSASSSSSPQNKTMIKDLKAGYELKQLLTFFYIKHSPEKSKDVDMMIRQHEGKERQLLYDIETTYANKMTDEEKEEFHILINKYFMTQSVTIADNVVIAPHTAVPPTHPATTSTNNNHSNEQKEEPSHSNNNSNNSDDRLSTGTGHTSTGLTLVTEDSRRDSGRVHRSGSNFLHIESAKSDSPKKQPPVVPELKLGKLSSGSPNPKKPKQPPNKSTTAPEDAGCKCTIS